MKTRKHTRRALCMSFVSLLLCCSMLVGSTFAWFTDTATTNVNSIQAGTLDVVLEMSYDNGGKWEDANGKTLEFRDANGSANILWEPGAEFKLPQLRIRNNGNLALKFKVVVSGLTGDMILADVLDVKLGGTKVDTLTKVMQLNAAEADGMIHGELAANTASPVYEISLKMQESANNDYQEKKLSGLAITVYATQDTVEWDSVTDQYDKDAFYSDSVQIVAGQPTTLQNGGTTVTIPAGALTAGQIVKLQVTDASPAFTVSAYDTEIMTKDISIVDADGKEIAMHSGTYSVTMDIGKGLDSSKLALYHNDKKISFTGYDTNTGILTYTTDSFSPFTVVKENIATIDSAEKLVALSAWMNSEDNTNKNATGVVVNLTKNIDLAGVEWTPIANFAGIFDGHNNTISNMKDAALFGTIAEAGVVKNVNLKDVSIEGALYMGGFLANTLNGKAEYCTVKNATATSTHKGFSGLVGFSGVAAAIDHCSVDNYTLTVTNTGDNGDKTGGLVGQSSGSTIKNSSVSNITLNGVYKTKEWGGFAGRHANNGTIENCTATNVKINVSDYAQSVGGFVGAPANATIKNCDVNGVTIKVNNCGWVGGFAGYIGDANTYNFDDCNVTGMSITLETDTVSGIGGFCGRAAYTLTIKNSSVAGTIDATDAAIATGKIKALVGYDRVDQYPDIMVTENNTTNVTIQ